MISVCMIVKNEENFIEDCLKSVKPFAGEIVVVDNGSTDKTNDILKKYNCKIINGTQFDLDTARDLYLKEAKYPWILTIDADERMEKCDVQNLYNQLKGTEQDVLAYNLKSFQYIGDGKWADAEIIRLFRNGRNIKYNGSSIHATLEPSILSQGGKIKTLNWYMHHVDILYINRTSRKRNNYTNKLIEQLKKQDFKKNDLNSYYLYHIFLGMEYVAINRYNEADICFREAISNDNMFQDYAKDSLYRSYLLQNKYELIPDLIDLEKDHFINDIDFYDKVDIMGNVWQRKNKKLAIALYRKVLENNIQRPSDYINLAFLIKDNDREYALELLDKARKLNSYLDKDVIYGCGDKPNLFSQASCFLLAINNVKDLFTELEQ